MNVDVDDALSISNVPDMLLEGHWFLPKHQSEISVPIMVTGYQQRSLWIDQLQASFTNSPSNGENGINIQSMVSLGQDGEVAAFNFLVTAPAWNLIENNEHTVCFCITNIEAEPMTQYINMPVTWCGDLYRQNNNDGTGLGQAGDDSQH
jgi:hypothetical protein